MNNMKDTFNVSCTLNVLNFSLKFSFNSHQQNPTLRYEDGIKSQLPMLVEGPQSTGVQGRRDWKVFLGLQSFLWMVSLMDGVATSIHIHFHFVSSQHPAIYVCANKDMGAFSGNRADNILDPMELISQWVLNI